MQTRTQIPIAFDRAGSGEPLVLIHGIGHRRQAWQPAIGLLATEFDVINLDLPGFGESPPLPEGVAYDIETSMANLAAFFDALDLGRPHVAGNSLGGALALELADRGLVRTATALSPAGFWSSRQRAYAIAVLTAHRRATRLPRPVLMWLSQRRLLRRYLARMIFEHPERIAPEDYVADAVAMRNGQGFVPTVNLGRTYRCMADPTVPTTIAWGDHDRILAPSQAKLARAQIPQARFEELRGCGHVPMFDDPGRVAEVIAASARA